MITVRFGDNWYNVSLGHISGNLRGYTIDYGRETSPQVSLGKYTMDIKVASSSLYFYYNNTYLGNGGTVSGSFNKLLIGFQNRNDGYPMSPCYINNIYIGPERS